MAMRRVLLAIVLVAAAGPLAAQLTCPNDPPLRIEKGPYLRKGYELTSAEFDAWLSNIRYVCENAGTGTGSGSSLILDLGDDGSNESAALGEIATSGPSLLFSEPSPNKFFIDLTQPWPTATALASDPVGCGANQFGTDTDASGALTCAQPAFSNLSGSASAAQLPAATTTTRGGVVLSTSGESTAGEVVTATDARLTDNRTPTSHASTHANGGSDELSVEGLSGLLADPQTPDVHASTHEQGQSDALSGTLAVSVTGNAGTATALAANGTNCAAGEASKGVDASGNAEGCFTPAGGGGGSSNSFETIDASSGTDPVADSATDTLTLSGGTGITVTGSSTTDTVTIATTVVDTDTDDQVATEVPYTPGDGADWTPDPTEVGGGLDQLAQRLTDEEAKADDDVPEAGDFGALALTGDVTSSGLATTIAANSVALTTDTTGNYVASVATTSPLTGGAAGSEGGTLTLGLTQHAGTDVTADLEEETHASEHSAGGADAVTATNLASACTDAQVLGGNAGATGVECQADDDTPDAGDYGNLSATAPITQSGGTISTSIATGKLVGRTTASTGVMETITPDATLSLAAGGLSVVDVTCTGCLGATEVAALDAGDTTSGSFADARVDGSLESDEIAMGGDLSGAANAAVVADDSHSHGDSTISNVLTVAAGDAGAGTTSTRAHIELLSHNTDCTALTDGTRGEACHEEDSDRIFICEPTAGGCDTAGEWVLSVDGVDDDVPEAGDFGALALTGDVTSSGLATTIAADSVALTTDTTGNYAAGDAEGGAALTGDSATGFFSAGTIEDARIDGSAEADEVNPTLGTQTQGSYVATTTSGLGISATGTGEGSTPTIALDTSATLAGNSALAVEECVFTKDGSGSGGLLCEGTTADTQEQLYLLPSANGNDTTSTLALIEGDLAAGSQVSDDSHNHTASTISALDTGDTTTGTFVDARVDGSLEADEVNPTLGTQTQGNYAAGDAEAGAALTGDTATAFFSAGAVEVARGGTGAAPGADDQVLVSSSTSAASWLTLPDSDAAGTIIGYDVTTNAWSTKADDDVPDAGEVDDTALAAGAVDGGSGGEVADASITKEDLGAASVEWGSEIADDGGCSASQTYRRNGTDTGWECFTPGAGSAGDVVGPSSATDNAIVRFDTTTGKLVQDSGVTMSDLALTGGQVLTAAVVAPTQSTAARVGNDFVLNASNATAGSSTAGAAAGGAVSINGGNAARLTSGFAAGGAVTATGGTGISVSDGGNFTGQGGVGGDGSGSGGAARLTGGAGGAPNGNGGTATVKAGAASGSGTAGAAVLTSANTANNLTCDNTSCRPGGTWTITPRAIVPLAGQSGAAITTQAADDCTIVGTNLSTTFKTLGTPTMVKMDGFTTANLYCRAKEGSAQTGTISIGIRNLTDSTDLITAGTTTSATCVTVNASASGLALTGAKELAAQIKSSVATDDPQFGSCVLVLEP